MFLELLSRLQLDLPDSTKIPKSDRNFPYGSHTFPIYNEELAGERELFNRYSTLLNRYNGAIRSLLPVFHAQYPSDFDIEIQVELIKEALSTGYYQWIRSEMGDVADLQIDIGHILLNGIEEPFTSLDQEIGDRKLLDICEQYYAAWVGLSIAGDDALSRANTVRTMKQVRIPNDSGVSAIDLSTIDSDLLQLHTLIAHFTNEVLAVSTLTAFRCGDVAGDWRYLPVSQYNALLNVINAEILGQQITAQNSRITYVEGETVPNTDFLAASTHSTSG